MYSILRFTGSADQLVELGQEINKIAPGTFEQLSPRGDQFPIDVSRSSQWHDHRDAAAAILTDLASVLKSRDADAIGVTFDVACEESEYVERLLTVFRFDREMIALCHDLHVEIEVTVYGQGEQ